MKDEDQECGRLHIPKVVQIDIFHVGFCQIKSKHSKAINSEALDQHTLNYNLWNYSIDFFESFVTWTTEQQLNIRIYNRHE